MSFARHVLAIPALVLAACTTTEIPKVKISELDEALLERHVTRLMKPFRTGNSVLCQKLVIDVNPVLIHHLTFPAGIPKRQTIDGVPEMTWSIRDVVATRKRGKPLKPFAKLPKPREELRRSYQKFKIMIGSTVFMVDDRVTVRRLTRAAPTLTALASGHVMVIQHGKNASSYQQVRYIDGRIEVR